MDYGGLLYLVRGDAEYVIGQNDYVGELADFERALVALRKLRVGARLRVRPDGLFDSDLLFGDPPARILAIDSPASHRRVNAEDGRERRHVPIRAERQRRARVEQRA